MPLEWSVFFEAGDHNDRHHSLKKQAKLLYNRFFFVQSRQLLEGIKEAVARMTNDLRYGQKVFVLLG